MTVELRAHHLLCMLTYVGRGYSPAFTENYDKVVARLAAGENILIREGPDDICQPLLATTEPHCVNGSVADRDIQAMSDVGHLLGRPLRIGDTINLDAAAVDKLRIAFAKGESRRACADCEWFDFCSAVSKAGYADVRLKLG
ncbi:DUF1284 domain-containing protein [Phyllobacterium endophyticum]|uniref:DUF1284 domain-containing protein n=1 Tax=Phyllobacterium endophyticum TaxID=1149773 RepID=A0A2P7ALP8_9HYPH|nr:DUF1284 domain-containing protein [Phyllobacterium endophyticum]MBB3236305.1 hypothetical protein [Phyllobacterium endophyticum]PSH55148.1 DUF1284 domain-containing protein [Phyllobacterium endophyticum]TYR39849.1 DUF1284 domain-containing protein [Phyllobacterium endophyticum]